MRRIIRELYQRGIPTPQGKQVWAPAVISGILKNPTYSGRYHALRRRQTILVVLQALNTGYMRLWA